MQRKILVLLLVLFVACCNSDGEGILVPGDQINAINDAINAASDGDILFLEAGKSYKHRGVLIVDKDLTFKAVGDLSLGKPRLLEISKIEGKHVVDHRAVKVRANCSFNNIFFDGEINGSDNKLWTDFMVITETEGITVVFDNCTFYKTMSATLSFRKPTNFIAVTNCLFLYDLVSVSQSNGRSIDFREGPHSKVLIQNNTFTNCSDRWIRHLKFGEDICPAIDSLIIDHNTFTQNQGYRPAFQFSSVKFLQFTNNIVINPVMFGTDTMTNRLDEINWMNPDVVAYKGPNAITIFNVIQAESNNTKIVMEKNNVYLDPRIESLYESSEFVSKAPMYNNEMLTLIDIKIATFSEMLQFAKGPVTYLETVQEYIACLDTLSKKGIQIRLWKNRGFELQFPYNELDLTYNKNSKSYTGVHGGFPLGDLNWFPTKKAEWEDLTER